MGLLSRAQNLETALNETGKNPGEKSVEEKISIPATPEQSSGGTAAVNNHLEEQIAQYHRVYADFNCILLDFPEPAVGNKADFCKTVSEMMTQSGTVIPLTSGRPLILLPVVKDRELIVHRLTKSLKTKELLSFEANSPENVLHRINSLTLND